MERTTHYPNHLASLVAARLRPEHTQSPPEALLTRLLETLYFASFHTDEGRRIVCTVNYLGGAEIDAGPLPPLPAGHWTHVRFDRPLPYDVRTLVKLARAADPDVSSLTVFSDRRGDLFIAGMVDLEPRHRDYITLGVDSDFARPGLLRATINGTGNISVYHKHVLVGSLAHDALVEAYHDVLWSGPVHQVLAGHLRCHLDECRARDAALLSGDQLLEHELLLRWLNAISRMLLGVQHYRQGGGLLITNDGNPHTLSIKYRIQYDRLLAALVGMVQAHFDYSQLLSRGQEPGRLGPSAAELQQELEQRKREVLGAARFIASLSCVDGVVLLSRTMGVRGFGVELRTDNRLSEVYLARDSEASAGRLRCVEITQFGTRHRAMMRYCDQHPGSLGFVVSQDGAIQALARLDEKLVLWENIDVQLAFKPEAWRVPDAQSPPRPVLRRVNSRPAE